MPPRKRAEFYILNLSYLPVIPPEYPITKFKYRRNPPLKFLDQAQDWFNDVMLKKISRMPSSPVVSYFEWRITSDDVNLFTINGCRFDQITVIFGKEDIHWAFYQRNTQGVRILGCIPLIVKYCFNCLNSNYKMLIESIKILINRYLTCNLCLTLNN